MFGFEPIRYYSGILHANGTKHIPNIPWSGVRGKKARIPLISYPTDEIPLFSHEDRTITIIISVTKLKRKRATLTNTISLGELE